MLKLFCFFFLLVDETCRADEFTCANGKCIQQSWRCDHDDDCGDRSDEIGCPTNNCNNTTEFQCLDGICLTLKWRCDGEPDCPDGSDEQVNSFTSFLILCIRGVIVMCSIVK